MGYVPLRKAAERLGLGAWALRKAADSGKIPSVRSPSGQRLFDVDAYLGKASGEAQTTILYCRVSSTKQRDDLQRQKDDLLRRFPSAEVVEDIGGGLNLRRRGLQAVLERAMQGESIVLVVAHKDRLARFGFDLLESILERSGGKVLVLNSGDGSPEEELCRDILAVLHVFSCKINGNRAAANRRSRQALALLSNKSPEDLDCILVRRVPMGIQCHRGDAKE